MINLFFGEDSFSIQKELSLITVNEGAEIMEAPKDINQLANEMLSSSFFSNQRIFISSFMLEKLTESEEKKLINALEKKPTDTTVIFIEKNKPKGLLGKFLNKNAKIISFEKPSHKDLLNFIKTESKKIGAEISPLATERLASFVGPDYWQLKEEVKKLALYKKNDQKKIIQVSDIESIVSKGFEANIFELMDALSVKNIKKANNLLNKFFETGESEMYIFAMIARQFRNIAAAKFSNLTNEYMFSKNFGIAPFVAKISISQARNFSREEIVSIYKKMIDIDLSMKSGIEPKQALRRIIFS